MEIFFSSIQPHLKRYLIRRSSFFALPGFFLLLYMGIFLSTSSLAKWGLWGFVLGFILISYGMIPYRKIIHLETKPHSLTIEESVLRFHHSKKGEVVFPKNQIETLSFLETKRSYGIRLHMKDGSHFLLPFFTKKTFLKIENL